MDALCTYLTQSPSSHLHASYLSAYHHLAPFLQLPIKLLPCPQLHLAVWLFLTLPHVWMENIQISIANARKIKTALGRRLTKNEAALTDVGGKNIRKTVFSHLETGETLLKKKT